MSVSTIITLSFLMQKKTYASREHGLYPVLVLCQEMCERLA